MQQSVLKLSLILFISFTSCISLFSQSFKSIDSVVIHILNNEDFDFENYILYENYSDSIICDQETVQVFKLFDTIIPSKNILLQSNYIILFEETLNEYQSYSDSINKLATNIFEIKSPYDRVFNESLMTFLSISKILASKNREYIWIAIEEAPSNLMGGSGTSYLLEKQKDDCYKIILEER